MAFLRGFVIVKDYDQGKTSFALAKGSLITVSKTKVGKWPKWLKIGVTIFSILITAIALIWSFFIYK